MTPGEPADQNFAPVRDHAADVPLRECPHCQGPIDVSRWEIALSAAEAQVADTRRALADAEQIARWFHESYERLAPMYGYKTRDESAVPWEQVPENNRKLMVATIRTVLALLAAGEGTARQPKRSAITVIQERLREGTAPSEEHA